MIKFLKNIINIAVFVGIFGCFAALSYVISQKTSTEINLEKLLINDEKKVGQAFFSPDDNVKEILVSLINAEKKKISVTMYMLTDKGIARALTKAHDRGVLVECVVDRSYGTDRYSKISLLANAQIPLWVYQPDDKAPSLMHNKFCIFEDSVKHHSLLWTGSYNFTMRANLRNQENVILVDDKRIIEQYEKQFEVLKQRSLQISGKIQNRVVKKPTSESSWNETFWAMFH